MNFLIAFTIPFFIIFFLKILKKRRQQLPPGPRKLPIIGNLHQLGKLPHRSLQSLSNEYGDLMFLQLGSIPTLVVSSAEIAEEIFKTHDIAFSGRPVLYCANKLSYNGCSVSLAPYGDHWRELKKILIVELLSAKRVQSFEAIRDEEVGFMMNCIAHKASVQEPINLSELALSLANKIICRVAFGKRRDDDGENKFLDILPETQKLLGTFAVSDFIPWLAWINKFNGLESSLENNFRQLDDFFNEVINEHLDPKRPQMDHEDVVDVMLRLQKDQNQAITLKNEHIKGLLADIFIAGSDTSAATIVWTMAELIKNPIVLRKAQKEVREAVKLKMKKVNESDLPKLVYLKMVIKESFRLHPPAPLLVPREITEDCKIQEYEIPAKTRVFVNAAGISTDPKNWKNPYEFHPERFSDNSIDFRGQNFELIPFGAGRRGCPGINFSIPLVELALANLLNRFNWTLPEGMLSNELDMEEAVGLTMHKKTPLYLVPCPI